MPSFFIYKFQERNKDNFRSLSLISGVESIRRAVKVSEFYLKKKAIYKSYPKIKLFTTKSLRDSKIIAHTDQ